MSKRRILLKGDTFNRLTFLQDTEPIRSGKRFVRGGLFMCGCGITKPYRIADITSGRTQSCGCYHRERASTHKMSKTRFYKIWQNMKMRCGNPKQKDYKYYGARGIQVCKDWQVFNKFQRDMHLLYLLHAQCHGEEDTTLERINVDKDYTLQNCRWATHKEQQQNKSHGGTN